MQIRFLTASDIETLADISDLTRWVEMAMIASSNGEAILPLRQGMAIAQDIGTIGMMPGYLASEHAAGVKLVSLVPPAARKGSSHLGLFVLYDDAGLVPISILDGSHVTAIRTAAASAVATSVLARKDARVLAVLGAGEQGVSHVRAMASIRPLSHIRLWNRPGNADKVGAVGAKLNAEGLPVRIVDTVAEAVESADIICTTTGAAEPILFGDQVAAGAHVNLVGSSHAGAREADTNLLLKARIFLDYERSARAQAGELIKAIEDGDLSWDDIAGEIGRVLDGRLSGRQNDEQITIYKSLGIAAQDIVTAKRLFVRACERGIGQVVTF